MDDAAVTRSIDAEKKHKSLDRMNNKMNAN